MSRDDAREEAGGRQKSQETRGIIPTSATAPQTNTFRPNRLRLFTSEYLDQRNIDGLKHYKYRSINDNPLATYILVPFWNNAVNILPRKLHPNILTICSFLSLLSMYLYVEYLIYMSESPSIPLYTIPGLNKHIFGWMAVIIAIAHHFDGMDGSQARRIGVSSFVGELLDHGLDSWNISLLIIVICRIAGIKRIFFHNTLSSFTFFLPHWEKQFTGILVLPWIYESIMVFGFNFFLLAYLYPHTCKQLLQTHANLLEKFFISLTFINTLATLYSSLVRVYKHIKQNYPPELFYNKLYLSFISLGPITINTILFAIWLVHSPNRIANLHPSLFNWCFSTICSHLTCHTIIASMSGIQRTGCHSTESSDTHTDLLPGGSNWRAAKLHCWDSLMTPVFASVMAILFLGNYKHINYTTEYNILKLVALTITCTQIHFGACVIRQLCEVFNLNFFFVP